MNSSNKKILLAFFKDHIGFSVAYFLSNILLAIFYGISTRKSIEIIYPIILTLFIYMIASIIKFYKYYVFNSKINFTLTNIDLELEPSSYERQATINLIKKIHQNYLEQIHNIKKDNNNQKRFISQWIHNMKTPISVIDLILQKTQLGEIQPSIANCDIQVENNRLLSGLEQVLNIIRLDDFSYDYVPDAINLFDAVKKSINKHKSLFIYNNVYPKLQAIPNTIKVLSDSKWNEVMLGQIITNAIKYSGAMETSKSIFFSVQLTEENATLIIRDEGIGIPKVDLQRIFEPFFTGQNGRLNEHSTGIGLFFCHEIAKKLDHKIEITSSIGCGTEVSITYTLQKCKVYSETSMAMAYDIR